jgi:hypothetical protein
MARLNEITEEQKNRLRANAAKAQASSLPFIRFENGEFKIGGVDVTDCEFMAVPDRCDAVWNHFPPSGGVEEILRVNMTDGTTPARPKIHDDRDQWVKDSKGQPKDPLGMQYELPLIENESGRLIVLKASTKLAREAVGRLLDDFAEKVRRPFVTLTVTPNPDNVKVKVPDFTITGYSEDLEDLALPGFGDKKSLPPTNGSNPPSRTSDMDDAIPF